MSKGTILVMDDEELIRNIAGKMLERLGYTVITVEDGESAIETYKDYMEKGEKISAVIIDLTILGGMGGVEAIKKLSEIDNNIKAIVSTDYSTDPAVLNFKEYGFTAAINKPFQLSELEDVINSVV